MKINIEESTVQSALAGIATLCNGLMTTYDHTLDGVLTMSKRWTTPENAYDFVVNNYDVTRGAIAVIQVLTEIIGDAMINEDIILCGKEEFKLYEELKPVE